jgi:hypothetical protein
MLQEVKSINAPFHRDPGPSSSQPPPAMPPSDHQKLARGPHKPESGSHSLVHVVPFTTTKVLCHPSMLFPAVLGVPRLLSGLLHRRVFLTHQPELLQASSSAFAYDDAIFLVLNFSFFFVLFSCLYLLFF